MHQIAAVFLTVLLSARFSVQVGWKTNPSPRVVAVPCSPGDVARFQEAIAAAG
jgi:hypothetical protein